MIQLKSQKFKNNFVQILNKYQIKKTFQLIQYQLMEQKRQQKKSNKSYQINSQFFFVLYSFLQLKISKSKTNKLSLFTKGQVSNLRDQCNLLKQNLSLMHLLQQLNSKFLNIEEKIKNQKVHSKEKMKKKYEIIRLINQQQKIS
ncbi:hypothetical protein TTHERM_000200581 (macronuclear) [Tetrahymena thermophila SB210]|uniref:Uncharacterized protein n=1 Tax=Tetrahymena thermophila (strain SB210) TaxID=312017 RepID=W7XHD7_TETTS|nr:hypothetical protein TTHERM_000200581 [Tetrahymena thermophila SB210]EWS76643.1 hypothetical protein TTHERM_000200581 [Tetrahymena thermophila SB210]|eukprot:XP_012650811.1 hypothetical protein TTHERM_000200581 [Tetrahymena thermophila SB210]